MRYLSFLACSVVLWLALGCSREKQPKVENETVAAATSTPEPDLPNEAGTEYRFLNKNEEIRGDGKVALVSPTEIRVYFRSIDAGRSWIPETEGTLAVDGQSTVSLKHSKTDQYLFAELPSAVTPPIKVSVMLEPKEFTPTLHLLEITEITPTLTDK